MSATYSTGAKHKPNQPGASTIRRRSTAVSPRVVAAAAAAAAAATGPRCTLTATFASSLGHSNPHRRNSFPTSPRLLLAAASRGHAGAASAGHADALAPAVPHRRRCIAPLSLLPGLTSLLLTLTSAQPASEAVCVAANTCATLTAALLFLLFFWTSLKQAQGPAWVAQSAAVLRPVRDELMWGCAGATAVQLCTAVRLCLSYPRHWEGVLVPLYGAGYACLAVLAASQEGRRLKGRVRMEIEAGEGERHSVMAQGSRLAARNYIWLITAVHLILQTGQAMQAAAAAAVTMFGTAAGASAAVPPPAGSICPPALAAAAGYGILAVLYGMAGAYKFLLSEE